MSKIEEKIFVMQQARHGPSSQSSICLVVFKRLGINSMLLVLLLLTASLVHAGDANDDVTFDSFISPFASSHH